MNPEGSVTLVPCDADILEVTAVRIIEHADALPDLTRCVVLLPDLQFAPRLRLHLLRQAAGRDCQALLGPDISTPGQWLGEHLKIDQTIPDQARRELLLVEVLKQHPAVFCGSDPWRTATSLLALFDELTHNRVTIPDDPDLFVEQLQSAYGITDRLPQPLSMEASVVHRLWQAWHTQLNAENLLDPGMAYLQRLTASQDGVADYYFFLVGFDNQSAAELEWGKRLLQQQRAQCIRYRQAPHTVSAATAPGWQLPPDEAGSPDADHTATTGLAGRCLDATFGAGQLPPVERAQTFAQQYGPSPLSDWLSILPASSAEQEARAIDLQVRRWLLEDRQPVGIVTEDRRLARRVRALLERAGITLQDAGGWALSTTSAAAALERWLQTVEEDFAHQPLLAVLKSPFIFPDDDREELDSTVYRFEQDIVHHENIARGLARYRKHIGYRLQRLNSPWTAETATSLQVLLNRLDQAADPLRAIADMQPHPPAVMLERLEESLQALGMWASFNDDPAGRRVLQEWQLLHAAAQHSDTGMNWLEFRAWLGTSLERHVFRPATAGNPVLLLTLQQAQLGQYAGLVIGACDHEHLPAATHHSPFFNDPVRRDLGLPVWPDHYQLQLNRFRRLLESASAVLLTWHQEDNGETRLPSNWLEAIQTFHQSGWGDDLINRELEVLLHDPATEVRGANILPVPGRCGFPIPVLPAELVPRQLSASSHQQLIDCPYRFYAAYGLGLKPRETIREALEKSDYGERIHLCLEIFHQGRTGYPGPFNEPLTLANRAAAVDLLEQIAHTVFARDLEDNFEHRGWLRRWQVLIPDYIDWQIRRQAEWDFAAAEQQLEVMLEHNTSIRGRLDRIDSGAGGIAVIDYKTGTPPGQHEVDSGEAIQLPCYALLTDTLPARVEYLKLDKKVAAGAALEGESLATLAGAIRERALMILDAIESGVPLPAWGDRKTCRYCEMDGLCRQQAWQEEAEQAS